MKKIIVFALFSLLVLPFQSCDNDDDTPPVELVLAIGDFHEGGVIFYLDDTGDHGFVCAVSDQSFETQWGCPPLLVDGAMGLELGTGAQNTLDIVDRCDDSGIAAQLCDNLILNDFSDWFLPSRDELNVLYVNRELVNETAIENDGTVLEGTEYWSSSLQTGNTVFIQNFIAGNQFGDFENSLYNVRAIRAF